MEDEQIVHSELGLLLEAETSGLFVVVEDEESSFLAFFSDAALDKVRKEDVHVLERSSDLLLDLDPLKSGFIEPKGSIHNSNLHADVVEEDVVIGSQLYFDSIWLQVSV